MHIQGELMDEDKKNLDGQNDEVQTQGVKEEEAPQVEETAEEVSDEIASPTAGDTIAQELLPVSLETEMRQSYLDYAMSVIVGRALPDVRDGLKPVHRRVLYAMKEIGNVWSSPTKKAARVVGEVIGKFHPHGDSAAYQTIVRMAQDFSLRYPLIYGQGNFGSIDGDGAAAMRYTEVRLMKVAEEMLADLHEDTVDYIPNFDNSELEPVVLPTRLPELIVNGSSGIAVGMTTNIPPHNLRETVDACVHALEHPDCTIDELIRRMPAPDFPTGGIIFGLSGAHQAYRTGRGRILMRARTHFEEFGNGRTRIVIDEIPYMVNKRIMYEKMHELWRDKKIEGISEMRDESSEKIRIAIDLRMGAMPEVVLNNLFKNTQMQESFSINMVALVDGQPMLLNLKQLITYFLAHRREVVTRRTVFRLKKSRAAGHILAGQAIALANIDEFIRIIRDAKTVEEAQAGLLGRGWPQGFAEEITRRVASYGRDAEIETLDPTRGMQADGLYYLTKTQVENILAMNLRRLTGLEREKILADYQTTVEHIFDYIDILRRSERVTAIIRDELLEIRESFGDDRRSTIELGGDPNFNQRDLIPRRDMVVTMTLGGYVKSQDLADYNAQVRGGKGRNVQSMVKDDEIERLFIANTHDVILCFTTLGKVYALDVYNLPEGKANARGRPIVNLLPLEEDEHINCILPVQTFDDTKYVFLATNKGTVKRTPLSAFSNLVSSKGVSRGNGIRALVLHEGERLVRATITSGEDDVFLFSSAGRAIRFKESCVRVMGRSAHGVRGIRLPEGAELIALATTADTSMYVLTASEHGYGKLTPVTAFTCRANRGSRGMLAMRLTEKTGQLAAGLIVTQQDEIMLLSTGGKVVRTRAGEISVCGRSTRGVILIRLGEETIASIERIDRTSDEEDDTLTHLEIETDGEPDDELEDDDLDDADEDADDEALDAAKDGNEDGDE